MLQILRSVPKRQLLAFSAKSYSNPFSSSARSFGPQDLKIVGVDSNSITLSGLIESSPAAPVKTRFLNLFLRDADPTPGAVDTSTSQKTFSTAQVPSSIVIKSSQILPSLASKSSPATTATCTNPADPALEITWSDGLISVYPFAFLERNATYKNSRDFRYLDQEYIPWSQLQKYPPGSKDAEIADRENRGRLDISVIPRIDYNDYISNDKDVYRAVKALHDYGLVFIKNVPDQEGIVYGATPSSAANSMSAATSDNLGKPSISPDTQPLVAKIANRIGYIKQTFYGPTWQVISIPDPKNVAYSSVYLPLHMDLCYYESPPGVQLLHVIQNSTTGGESLFADSFAAAEQIANADPEAYEALTKVPITFHYDNDGEHYWYERPLIIEDPYSTINPRTGRKFVKALNYSPPFQGPLAGAMLRPNPVNDKLELDEGSGFSDSQIAAFHRGYKMFEDYISDKNNQIEVKMEENLCVLFMNRRTLHARNEFDQNSGKRWFQGTYLDLDAWQSKLRMGVRQFENK